MIGSSINPACNIPLFGHCLLFDLLKARCLVILVDHLLEKILPGYQVFRLQHDGHLTNFTFFYISSLSKQYLIFEVGSSSHLDVHHTGLVEVRKKTLKFEVVCKRWVDLKKVFQSITKNSYKFCTFISVIFVPMELGHHISQGIFHQLCVTPEHKRI